MLRKLFCLSFVIAAAPGLAEPFALTMEKVASEQGQVVVQVYNSKKNWMSEKHDEMVLRESYPAAELIKNATVTLDLGFGEYAIQVFHDLDSDGEMKTNCIGIPKEPVGTSNNAKGRMGPPKYKDAKFVFDEQNTQHTLTIVEI